jgi:hypothetical protein
VSGDGVIDLTPDDQPNVTLPLPPRALAAVPAPAPVDVVDEQPEPLQAVVTLRGRTFPVRPQGIGLLSLMKFATLAKRGNIDSEDMEGLAALYDLLTSCIADHAWGEFVQYADAIGAKGEELIEVVRDAVTAAAAPRPTQPLSHSPGGQRTTGPSSAVASSSPGSPVRMGSIDVQRRLEAAGRPDIAQVVKRAREASTRTSTG